MCMIVDANRLGKLLSEPPDEDAAPIRRWLERANGTLVYSMEGKFRGELGGKARTKLANYSRAGKARLIAADRFADDERRLREDRRLKSDDPHVLALARISGVRLLYTGDKKLMADFKNVELVRPKGRVYSDAANARLLTSTVCAGGRG